MTAGGSGAARILMPLIRRVGILVNPDNRAYGSALKAQNGL
jgi:hypothetical protein